MKRSAIFLTTVAVVLSMGVLPAFAQRGGRGGSGGMSMPGAGGNNRGGVKQDKGWPKEQKQQKQRGPSVADELAAKPGLASRLQDELPPGTDMQRAARGFQDLGQFVAAVHVSHNLGIPFNALKAKVTGKSATSLGKAVKELKPDADAKAETKKAEKQAKEDMKQSKKA